MEQNEKRKVLRNARVQWCRQLAFILKSKMDEYKISEACKNCTSDDPMFETSCEYVGFHYEIGKLVETLRNQANYCELLIDQDF